MEYENIINKIFCGVRQTKGKDGKEFTNMKPRPLSNIDKFDSCACKIKEGVILLDVDEIQRANTILQIIKDNKINCYVFKTYKGMHFYFKDNDKVKRQCTNYLLACGIAKCDFKSGNNNGNGIIKTLGNMRPLLYGENITELDPLPHYLRPLKPLDKLGISEGFGLDKGNRQNYLTMELLKAINGNLSDLSNNERFNCLEICNKYAFNEPLENNEINALKDREDIYKWTLSGKDQTSAKADNSKYDFEIAKELLDKYKIIDNMLYTYKDGYYTRKGVEKPIFEHLPYSNKHRIQEVKYKIFMQLVDTSSDITTNNITSDYICFNNGLYDLKKRELIPHNKDIVIINKIPLNYNIEAYNDKLDNVLNTYAGNNEDVRALLNEVIGYCLFNSNIYSKAFILKGRSGRGKSTFLNLIQNVLGEENYTALSLAELGDKFSNAQLHNKLACLGDDIESGIINKKTCAMFKKITSGERFNAQYKGKDGFDFKPRAKLVFTSNELPQFEESGEQIYNRLIIVPFNADIEKDPQIKGNLINDKSALEYVANIAITALCNVRDNKGKFTTPKCVSEEIARFIKANDPIKEFTDIHPPKNNDIISDYYEDYKTFCNENNYRALPYRTFNGKIYTLFNMKSEAYKLKNGTSARVFIQE